MKLKKFLPNKFWTSVILTVFVCVALSWKLFLSRDVILSFHQKANKDITYKIYYITRMEYNYREKDSTTETISGGNKDVSITLHLPSKSLWKFKIAIQNATSQKIELSNIEIKGKTTQKLTYKNLSISKFDGFTSSKVKNDALYLETKSGNNEIDFNTEGLKIDGINTIDFYILSVLILIYSIIIYKFIEYLANYKKKRGYSRIDIVFLAVFFFGLWLPMLNISDADISFKELRSFTPMPEFNIKNLSGYGKQFNEWFSDHFFGRQEFLQIHSLKNSIQKYGNDRVLVGKDGWWFFKGNNSLRNYQNIDLFTEEQLKKIAKYLTDFNDWAKNNGKDFYYIICPDKNKIYGEYFSDAVFKINPDSKSRAKQLADYLKNNTDIKVILFYDTIYNNKDKGILFFKHDTHWNRLGGYIAYTKLMNEMRKYHKDIDPVTITTINYEKNINPDMESMFPSEFSKDETLYPVPEVKENVNCDSVIPTNRDFKCENKDKSKKKNLMVFRDSFTINMAPYLRNTFEKSRFLWHYIPTPEELEYAKDNADIIILENVERMLPENLDFNFPKE